MPQVCPGGACQSELCTTAERQKIKVALCQPAFCAVKENQDQWRNQLLAAFPSGFLFIVRQAGQGAPGSQV